MEIIIEVVMNDLEAILSFICAPLFFVLGKIILKRMQYKMRKSL